MVSHELNLVDMSEKTTDYRIMISRLTFSTELVN